MAKLLRLYPFNDFRATMQSAKTFGDMSRAIDAHLSPHDQERLIEALEVVELACGLTYADKALRGELKGKKMVRNMERDANQGGEDDCPVGAEDDYNRGF